MIQRTLTEVSDELEEIIDEDVEGHFAELAWQVQVTCLLIELGYLKMDYEESVGTEESDLDAVETADELHHNGLYGDAVIRFKGLVEKAKAKFKLPDHIMGQK